MNINLFFNDKKANANYVSAVIGLFVIMLFVTMFIYIFPIFKRQQTLDTFARELVRCCEIDGTIDQEANIRRLSQMTGITPNINFDYDSYRGTHKVQLNHNIKVELSDTYYVYITTFARYPIDLRSIAYGKSEVYYK